MIEDELTPERWWENLNDNRDALRLLVQKYHPAARTVLSPMKITARKAEAVRKGFAEEIVRDWPAAANPVDAFDRLLQTKEAKGMILLLNEVWMGMPESMEVRKEKGFYTLCDLCSECETVWPCDS